LWPAPKIADRVTSENRKYRHTRGTAALIISEAINAPYSEETLRKSRCPYIRVARRALYRDDDLIAHAENILADAQKGGSSLKPCAEQRPLRPAIEADQITQRNGRR
jgi:hypothetical protein